MAKARQQFLCSACGGVQPKWMGKCPDCGAWDTLEPYTAAAPDKRRGNIDAAVNAAVPIDEVDLTSVPRLPTGIGELDRVLGGGIVPGAAVLVGGEPGIGKSTLLLQIASRLGAANVDRRVSSVGTDRRAASTIDNPHSTIKTLYCTSEESTAQTKLRAKRLNVSSPNLLVLAEANLDRILEQIRKTKPAVVIVDSIQMIYKPDLPAAPGSVTQLRDCCMELVYLAKATGTAVIVVGHVTKAGTLAGPKIIEHIVDTVVYFEGDRHHSHRIVRCVKNRFGSTHEVGLFEMTGSGLAEVTDPGDLFARPYGPDGPPSGSVLAVAMTGTRAMLLEVQALTAPSVIGAARRKVSGLSTDRVSMIIAVLERRCGLKLAAQDVYVNVAGGVRVVEPAMDLAVALAIASAHKDQPLPPGLVAIGELGLGGEIRSVNQLDTRLREAARLGVGTAVLPKVGELPPLGGVALHDVQWLGQALSLLRQPKG